MAIFDRLLSTLPDGKVLGVSIGIHWTAVVVEVDGKRRCGLASTLIAEHAHGVIDVPDAGRLAAHPARALAQDVTSDLVTMRSVGMATLNALATPRDANWVDASAASIIARHGAGQTVALIGHFPFIETLRPQVGQLHVLEMNPSDGELPAEAAPDVLPGADVIAITSMTLLNGTFDGLMALRAPGALVVLLGPTTPMSPTMFDAGVSVLCGSVVFNIDPVVKAVSEGASFRQLHKLGVRLVSWYGPDGAR